MTRTTLTLTLALLAAAPAHGWERYVLPPPAQYAGPYRGQLTEQQLPVEEVPPTCRALGVSHAYAWGCSGMIAPGHCMIVIPKVGRGVSAFTQEEIRKHELGHCNGWRHP